MSLFRERLLARLVDSHAISPELVAKPKSKGTIGPIGCRQRRDFERLLGGPLRAGLVRLSPDTFEKDEGLATCPSRPTGIQRHTGSRSRR
jgi:hypothetical protein